MKRGMHKTKLSDGRRFDGKRSMCTQIHITALFRAQLQGAYKRDGVHLGRPRLNRSLSGGPQGGF